MISSTCSDTPAKPSLQMMGAFTQLHGGHCSLSSTETQNLQTVDSLLCSWA